MRVLLVCYLFWGLSVSPGWAQTRKITPVAAAPASASVRSTTFTIGAKDEKTAKDLSATYSIQAVLAKKYYKGTSKPGKPYSFVLERSDTLVVTTRVAGYDSIEEIMVVSCDTCGLYEHIALMEKESAVFTDLRANQTIRLDNVYFDQGSYVMRKESTQQLDKLLNTLKANPKLKIEIGGHTDNVGDRRLNQLLSENRAKVIANYLLNKGVDESRLRYVGYGDARPVAPNDVEINKEKNRRVEFLVLEN
ncbi:hypothetical protein GCM10023189_34890 [Nibrella saemangeumensis]|uniref:OmpA-like domain-containing protein n=1 Tax=Nibrella saemangeumensis TaxID=1084526 RepID=A0ABP8N2H6_9BACT